MQMFEDAGWTGLNLIKHYIFGAKNPFFVFFPIHISGVCYGRNILHLCILNEYKYLNIFIIQLISNKAWSMRNRQ